MARAILASSPGWKVTEPRWTHSRAPLMFSPMTGAAAAAAGRCREGEGVAVALEVPGPADDDQGDDEGGDAEGRPDRLEAGELRGSTGGR